MVPAPVKITGTGFSPEIVQLIVRLVIDAAISVRAAARVIEITGQIFRQQLLQGPSHNTVGNLLQRIGLYEIMRVKETADDWIWVIDHTIQAGVTKCLLVLGIRAEDFRKLNRPLRCEDMSVLELLPVGKSTIAIVSEQLTTLSERMGVPLAIVSDEGSDLVGGVKVLQKAHPHVVHCHDIVHKLSRLIERILKNDSMWSRYRTKCCQSGNSIRQTTLAHLTPPRPKTKARHMNLDQEIQWGVRALDLLDRGIGDSSLSPSDWELLEAKLGWLRAYRRSLAGWGELMAISQTICGVVRRGGYDQAVTQRVRDDLPKASSEQGKTLIARSLVFFGSDAVASSRWGSVALEQRSDRVGVWSGQTFGGSAKSQWFHNAVACDGSLRGDANASVDHRRIKNVPHQACRPVACGLPWTQPAVAS